MQFFNLWRVFFRIPEPTWSLDAAANGKAAVKLVDEEHSHSRSKKYWPVLIKDSLHPQGSFDPMWNIIFIISCVLAVSLDPLFFYIPNINRDGKCFQLDKTLQTAALMLRSMTDLSYIVHIIFQTRTLVLSEVDAYSGASEVKSYTVSLKRMGGLVLGEKILQSSIPIDILCIIPLPQVRKRSPT